MEFNFSKNNFFILNIKWNPWDKFFINICV